MNDSLNQQNLELVASYKISTDKKSKEAIIKRILQINKPFLKKFIGKYPKDIREDLLQECHIALYEAVEGFDLEKDNSFLTYASYKIQSRTKNTKMFKSGSIASVYAKKVLSAYNKYENKENDIEIIARDLKTTPNTLTNAILSEDVCHLENMKDSIKYTSESDEDDFVLKDRIREIISTLTEREQFIINHFFGFDTEPLPKSKIGELLNPKLSRQRITAIYKKAMIKIKRQLLLGGIKN